MYDFPFPSAQMLKRLPPVTTAQTNKSITISKMTISMLKRLEENLDVSGIKPKPGSAAQGLLINGYPSDDAMHYEKSSMTITKASQNLVVTRCTRYVLRFKYVRFNIIVNVLNCNYVWLDCKRVNILIKLTYIISK